jgi:putative permease
MILVPLLVFFFLKDKRTILDWAKNLMPEHRGLSAMVWYEVDLQIGNYIRGRIWETLIIWAVCYLVFSLFGMQFAMLLGLLIGLSVFIPYVGALVVTIPFALVGYYQWGWSSQFAWAMGTYGLILALDANILGPLLLSEVVDLHPVGIIVAILFFGGMWGFWGIFFAIPLATLVQAVLRALQRRKLDASMSV